MKKVEQNIKTILKELVGNTDDEHLIETPKRVSKFLIEATHSHRNKLNDLVATFSNPSYDEIIILKNISFFSICSHHLLSFSGVVHVGYLPRKYIIGISKLARIVDFHSKKLQVQEKFTKEIVNTIDSILKPKGVACVVEAEHLCLRCRGVKQINSVMITSAMTGIFRKSMGAREEFLRLIGKV